MKFIVFKSLSPSAHGKSPCEGAVKVHGILEIERSLLSNFELREKGAEADWWFNNGKNHREGDNGAVRDVTDEYGHWVIEINTLEELVAFRDKYGDVLVRRDEPFHLKDPNILFLEIFDEYEYL